ncbi:hypothetical protein [Carnobacterium maltaromaticum]|uniref:hypothetical protein n=1 Tax=Carnobacterium maltaromaticum TaxID=2751 RepID=UPI0005595462|nr:hypothetical protein [Carnobacterium maltaromaticum]KRN62104.1 hypothetical protein IV70_GL000199 [Carnobacterium maltaromaticum DSM 20342]
MQTQNIYLELWEQLLQGRDLRNATNDNWKKIDYLLGNVQEQLDDDTLKKELNNLRNELLGLISQIVIEGGGEDSSVEVRLARTDIYGKIYDLLGDRLNADQKVAAAKSRIFTGSAIPDISEMNTGDLYLKPIGNIDELDNSIIIGNLGQEGSDDPFILIKVGSV